MSVFFRYAKAADQFTSKINTNASDQIFSHFSTPATKFLFECFFLCKDGSPTAFENEGSHKEIKKTEIVAEVKADIVNRSSLHPLYEEYMIKLLYTI